MPVSHNNGFLSSHAKCHQVAFWAGHWYSQLSQSLAQGSQVGFTTTYNNTHGQSGKACPTQTSMTGREGERGEEGMGMPVIPTSKKEKEKVSSKVFQEVWEKSFHAGEGVGKGHVEAWLCQ